MTHAALLRLYAPPVLAMALLHFLVVSLLGTLRLTGIVRREYPLRYFKLMQRPPDAQFPERTEAAARNFVNLFEMPVLFYALVPLLILANVADRSLLIVLWAYVGLRYAHSAIHLTVNELRLRFTIYALSCLALLAAWLLFAQRIL